MQCTNDVPLKIVSPRMSDSKDKPGMNELMDNSTFEQALIRTGDDEIDDISCLTDRFCALRSLYLETSSINDLDRVIAVVKHIVDSPIDDISRAVWLGPSAIQTIQTDGISRRFGRSNHQLRQRFKLCPDHDRRPSGLPRTSR